MSQKPVAPDPNRRLFLEQRFVVADVVRASGLSPKDIANYIARTDIDKSLGIRHADPGSRRMFSAATAVVLATIARLGRFGISKSSAAEIGLNICGWALEREQLIFAQVRFTGLKSRYFIYGAPADDDSLPEILGIESDPVGVLRFVDSRAACLVVEVSQILRETVTALESVYKLTEVKTEDDWTKIRAKAKRRDEDRQRADEQFDAAIEEQDESE